MTRIILALALSVLIPLVASGGMEKGNIHVLLFDGANPALEASVIIDGMNFPVNSQGEVNQRLPVGKHEMVVVSKGEIIQQLDFTIAPEADTQVILTLMGASSQLDLEQPKWQPKASAGSVKQQELVGRVLDLRSQRPVMGARVFVKNSTIEAVTNEQGDFSLDLPEGQHTLSIVHAKYTTRTIDGMAASDGKQTLIKVAPSGLDLEEFVVLAPRMKGSVSALLEIRRSSTSVADVIGAEQISQSGDSDVASSLRRVTGLTLIDGKYVYIRGLGERYSSALLNNMQLPSPEPARRVVPLDIFPTGMIENIVVQKSYSADMPGEFGGGVIQMKSKTIPDKAFVNVSVSASINPEREGEMALGYSGGGTDHLGIDDGTRKMPSSVKRAIDSGRKITKNTEVFDNGFEAEELAALSRDFNNTYAVDNYSNNDSMPSFSLSTGGKYKSRAFKVGGMFSTMYGNEWDFRAKRRINLRPTESGRLEKIEEYNYLTAAREIRLGSALDWGFEWGKNHSFGFTGILVRNTTDRTELKSSVGDAFDADTETRRSKLNWVERQLFSRQLRGKHKLGASKAQLNWRYGFSEASRYEPDRREYLYLQSDHGYRLREKSDGNERIYNELFDQVRDLGMDVEIPFHLLGREKWKAKAGYNYVYKQRHSDSRRFSFDVSNQTPDDLAEDVEDVLDPANRTASGILISDQTRETDNYFAGQMVQAGYGLIEVPITKDLQLVSGVRYERSIQDVATVDVATAEASNRTQLLTSDVLPSHSLTHKFSRTMQWRLAYSETVSRPDFRELSASPFQDDENDKLIRGNPELEAAVIYNTDLRWEWYPTKKESFSIGIFEKIFHKPIESIVEAGAEGARTFRNAEEARNLGLEIEGRKDLGFIPGMNHFSLLGNVSLIDSEIVLDKSKGGIQTDSVRPLQGQSPYSLNLQMLYDQPRWKFTASVLYNVFGARIADVGTDSSPNIIEEPVEQLDIVLKKKLAKNTSIGFKAKNLLDPEVRLTVGGELHESYRRGRGYSLSLSQRF